MFSGSKARMSSHDYYVRVLDVCVTLSCVYVCMLSGLDQWVICMPLLVMCVCLYVGRGPLCELGRCPLYLVGRARYAS